MHHFYNGQFHKERQYWGSHSMAQKKKKMVTIWSLCGNGGWVDKVWTIEWKVRAERSMVQILAFQGQGCILKKDFLHHFFTPPGCRKDITLSWEETMWQIDISSKGRMNATCYIPKTTETGDKQWPYETPWSQGNLNNVWIWYICFKSKFVC